MKNKLIKNTIILLITSLIIRALALLNRIILTRSLGEQGISLYSLIMPTIMLFMSLSSFSLNTSMIKVTATNKSKKIIKNGIFIALITTSISCIILLLILKILCFTLLKQPSTYYPIIFSIPLFYLTSISSILRGYLTGIEKMGLTSIANLIEQISRILFTIIIFIILNNLIKNNDIILYVTIAIIAMSIGELCSIIFSSIKISKIYFNNNINNNIISKELLDISIPSTLTSLISNITFFLEPIIFTFTLGKINVSSNDILLKYSEITAYSLPLITLFSFISTSISTVIMPKIANASNDEIKDYISKIIILCLIPSLLISSVLFNYNTEISILLYGITTGSVIVKKYVFLFICFYFIGPFNTILLSKNDAKKAFIISVIIHIIKLISLFVLPFITTESLIISYLISYLLTFILEYIILYKKYKFKILINQLITLLLITLIINFLAIILKNININYIVEIIIISIFYLILLFPFIKRNYI